MPGAWGGGNNRRPRHESGSRRRGWSSPAGQAGSGGWGRDRFRGAPRHPARFVGCLLVAIIVVAGIITALATWLAGTLLGMVAPGSGASAPTALAVLLVLVASLVLIGRMFGRSVGPLTAIADATERLADGATGVRVEVRGPGPVRRLAASFNAMAERMDRVQSARRALLADVTHELRTPLQVIAGSAEAMLDGVHPRDDEHLVPIVAETVVMNRLLDDLRTLSLAEAGALPLYRETVEIAALLAEVVAGHAAAANAAGLDLRAEPAVGARDPLQVDADPVRLREVMTNLVSNAIRHTPPGGTVRLSASRDDTWVMLTVHDTGEGIPAAELEQVFDRFHRRVDSGGSGLGLAIARDLVVAHGGTIRADSRGIPGDGATFTVRLPAPD